MAPNSSTVAQLLRQTIYYHLDNGSWDNALFFAERLSAHDARSNESAFLLALSHLRLGDNRSAYEISKPLGYRGLHLGCAFVFAQSCLALERFRDGVLALEKAKGQWLHKSNLGKHTSTTRAIYPDAAIVNCLLGKLCRGMDDRKKAAAYFEDALKTNPLMWDAFAALCDMGLSVRVANTFRVSDSLVRCFEQEAAGDAAEVSGPLSEQQLLTKRSTANLSASSTARNNLHDMSDPFDHFQSQSQAHSSQRSYQPNGLAGVSEVEENDFMARIFAARTRGATDFMATPPGTQQDPPQAPTRKRAAATAPSIGDSGFAEARQQSQQSQQSQQQQQQQQQVPGAPSRFLYRSGAAGRRGKPLDGNGEPLMADHASWLRSAASTTNGNTASSTAPIPPTAVPSFLSTTTDRKRTASGHPVAPRQTQGDDASVPQRRSARLNMFKSASSRTNSGVSTAGARELKKARPAMPRIVRPGSSGSTVGRVVSGNRKPVDDGGMDVDPMEGPRIREPGAASSQQTQQQQQQQQQQHQAASACVSAPATKQTSEADTAKIEEALRWIFELMKKLGGGYLGLAQFQCPEALLILNSLPRAHIDTPWVQAQMGRAHYEMAAYAEAEICFRRVRVLAPTRLEDMEVYSTILWFLKRETDLSFLAHELVDAAWLSPQAWCALGNAWSLAQDHEQALRCFRRATQLDPKFAYAYTLQGHEHVLNEEYDKALTAYRHAVAADRRHYNAYYGIGRVYEKLGNFDKAYAHYHTASLIHPTNAVLICCIGKVLERQKDIVPALSYFSKATELAPRAAQTRFRKARALLALGQLQAAQHELTILKDLAPDEAAVHFLLGKLFKTLSDKSSAVRHFTIALSLDPKASQKIKQAISSLEDDEDGLEDYMVL